MQADQPKDLNRPHSLAPYLSPAAAWALAVGTSVGWGSLVVTSTGYLSQAGPVGSAVGLLAGMLLMLLIARNYHFMTSRYPDAGGRGDVRAQAGTESHGRPNPGLTVSGLTIPRIYLTLIVHFNPIS